MSFKRDIEKLSDNIADLVKKELRNKGLVDTGKLVRSIKANVRFSTSGIKIDIEGEDYFKYLDKEYKITRDVFNSTEFDKILDKLTDLYGDKIIEDGFNE